jgi:hypothetical protein
MRNKTGHYATVYDRNDRHGGLLIYGIPLRSSQVCLSKSADTINNAHVGPRDPKIPGRDANGDGVPSCTRPFVCQNIHYETSHRMP